MERRSNQEEPLDLTAQRRKVLEAYWSLVLLSGDPYVMLETDLKAVLAKDKVDLQIQEAGGLVYKVKTGEVEITLFADRKVVISSITGEEKPLTGKEFSFLKILMEKPDSVVRHEEIRDELWPGVPDVQARGMSKTFAKRVRAKMGAGKQNPIIHNVRGLGYSLTPRVNASNGQ